MTGISGVKSRKLWDVMDTITVTNNADIEFIVVVNEPFWQGLTDGQRAIITAAAKKAESAVRDEMANIEAGAFKIAEENGMTVYKPNAQEIELWRTASQPVIDKWLGAAGALGKQVYDGALSLRM